MPGSCLLLYKLGLEVSNIYTLNCMPYLVVRQIVPDAKFSQILCWGLTGEKGKGIPQCSQESFSLRPVPVQHQDLCLQAIVASIVGHSSNNSASMVLQIRLAPLSRAHNVGCDTTQLCCHLPCLLWLASLQWQQAESIDLCACAVWLMLCAMQPLC